MLYNQYWHFGTFFLYRDLIAKSNCHFLFLSRVRICYPVFMTWDPSGYEEAPKVPTCRRQTFLRKCLLCLSFRFVMKFQVTLLLAILPKIFWQGKTKWNGCLTENSSITPRKWRLLCCLATGCHGCLNDKNPPAPSNFRCK